MKILSVIAEYNPFHNGHKLQAGLARACTGCDFAIALMSGNFVQRGEPVIVDKYLRAKMALDGGFDMVIELPVYYACASAEHFAYNAVRILNACGIVNSIAFGSESGNLKALQETAQTLANETDEYRSSLHTELNSGKSFPQARDKALSTQYSQLSTLNSQLSTLNSPNDILAIEYLKALNKTQSYITPIVIPRIGAGYHQQEITGEIASATAIRRAVCGTDGETGGRFSVSRREQFSSDKRIPSVRQRTVPLSHPVPSTMPEAAWSLLYNAFLKGNYVRGLDAYEREFRYALLAHPQLEDVLDISEGLQNRFLKMSGKFSSLSEIVSAVKTKRYTHTRLNRAALHILLDIRRYDFERFIAMDVPYIRVLGMKKTAGALMNALSAAASCPVVTTLTPARSILTADAWAMLEKEIAATDIYYLGLENRKPVAPGAEWRQGFVMDNGDGSQCPPTAPISR